MRKQIIAGALLMTVAFTLCGCEPLYREEQLNYKDMAVAEMVGGNYDKAVTYLDSALALCTGKISQTEIDINYYKGAALFAQGKYEDAIKCYDALIAYDEANYEPYFLRGCVYMDKHDSAKALADFERAVEIQPENFELYIKAYEIIEGNGYEAEADSFINKALALQTDKADGYMARGRIYYFLGDNDKAYQQLSTAIDKGASEARVYLAEVCESMGKEPEARKLLTEYVNTGKANSEALCSLGNMALESGQYKEALSYFQSGIAVDDAKSKQQLYRGEIIALEHLGQFRDAKLKMADYIAKYPTDEAAVREMIFLQTR